MPMKYKLTYFDGRGRGETIRWILLQGGVDFEDVRLNMEQWLELKPSKWCECSQNDSQKVLPLSKTIMQD